MTLPDKGGLRDADGGAMRPYFKLESGESV
jgi:hypothetical protein